MGGQKQFDFSREYDDSGLLMAENFIGQKGKIPDALELYKSVNNQFIQVANIGQLPLSATVGLGSVLDVRAMETTEPRPITSNRTGRAFFIDSFENYTSALSEKWRSATGTNELSTDFPCMNRVCMKMTTGVNATDTASVYLMRGAIKPSKIGVEFDFCLEDSRLNYTDLGVQLQLLTGRYYQFAQIWYNPQPTDPHWEYLNAAAVATPIVGSSMVLEDADELMWHHCKIVINFGTGFFDRLICDDTELDIKTCQFINTVVVNIPSLRVMFYVTNNTNGAARIFKVDNVVLTDSEP